MRPANTQRQFDLGDAHRRGHQEDVRPQGQPAADSFQRVAVFWFRSRLWVLFALLLGALNCYAQAHTITNCTDEALRAAVEAGGVVRFGCDGTILLQGPLTNEVDLVLDGSGHDVTISGQGFCRVLLVKSNVSLSLMGLKIADGRGVPGGAGVYNDGGQLTVQSCTFSNNIARRDWGETPTAAKGSNAWGGALFNAGAALISASTFISNTALGATGGTGTNKGWSACGDGGDAGDGGVGAGGAIYSNGDLEIVGSAFIQNIARGGNGGEGGRGGGGCIGGGTGGMGGVGGQSYGGALCNAGTARLVNVTFVENSSAAGAGGAGGPGGTMFPMYGGDGGDGNTGGAAFGGAIYDAGGTSSVTNCTLALNSAVAGAAGAAGIGGWATYGNGDNGAPGQGGSARGGGMDSDGAWLANVLLSGNTPENLQGTMVDAGQNLSSDNSGFTHPASVRNTDPRLGPVIGDHGGGPWMALMPGSPAIDAGNCAMAPLVDQRGTARPSGPACDIGAYEAGPPDIVVPPASVWVQETSTLELSASVTGYPPLSFSWFFNATNLLAFTANPWLKIPYLQPVHSGDYTLVVANSFGALTSSVARVEVFSRTITRPSEENLRFSLSLGGLVKFAVEGTIPVRSPLLVETNTTLDAGPHHVVIEGNGDVQLFRVASNVAFNIVGLALTRGLGNNGGAVWSAGDLCATNCVFLMNAAQGKPGDYQSWPANGYAGLGGAVYSTGKFNAESCSFLVNSATGGGGTPSLGGGGGLAGGGAIYSVGSLTLSRSLLASNSAAGGPGGQGRAGMASGDQAFPGESGGPGGDACGGAVFTSGTGVLVNCTIAWNTAEGGIGGEGGPGGFIWHDGWLFTGPPGPNGPWGATLGAVYSTNSLLSLTNCTIANNYSTVAEGGDGYVSAALTHYSAAIVNTILANNWPSNNSGQILDLGHNLSSDSSAAFGAEGSTNNIDPGLGALADHAGRTLTMALLPGSPAIDAADTTLAPATDQRGGSRPAGDDADIGAYEYGCMPMLRINTAGPGQCEIVMSEILVPTCRLLTSTNWTDWTPVATNSVGPDGTSVFSAAVDTNHVQQLYRIALP